jgi:hypothetical protein
VSINDNLSAGTLAIASELQPLWIRVGHKVALAPARFSSILRCKGGGRMTNLLSHLVDAPLANILILAGRAFLAIRIVGKTSGKIESSTTGRIISGLIGLVLLIYGIYTHSAADTARNQAKQTPGNKITIGRSPRKPRRQLLRAFSAACKKNANPQTRGITRLDIQEKGEPGSPARVHCMSAARMRLGRGEGLCKRRIRQALRRIKA